MRDKITCPSGHTEPVTSIHSYVDLKAPEIDDAITFECPGGKRGHTFTLRRALKAGTFNEEEAARIREGGKAHRAKYS